VGGDVVVTKGRRAARTIALQALYELDCTQHSLGEVMAGRLEETVLPDELRVFAYALVNGVLEYKATLDGLIRQHAPEFPLEQVAIVDRNLLRIALYEFLITTMTPVKVAIDEAVELAKEYGSESTARFVNGVLGALAAQMGKAESKDSVS